MLFLYPVLAQYIDPGTGSYLYQLAIAGFGALVFFFSFRMKGFFTRFLARFKKQDPAE